MKELQVPFTKQGKRMCGPTALYMILQYYNISTTMDKLITQTKATYIKGTTNENLTKTAQHYKLKATYSTNNTLQNLEKALQQKIPPIVGWTTQTSGSHYSIITGITKDKIILLDPEEGKKIIDKTTFLKQWKDINWEKISLPKKIYYALRQQLTNKIYFPKNKKDIVTGEMILIKP